MTESSGNGMSSRPIVDDTERMDEYIYRPSRGESSGQDSASLRLFNVGEVREVRWSEGVFSGVSLNRFIADRGARHRLEDGTVCDEPTSSMTYAKIGQFRID